MCFCIYVLCVNDKTWILSDYAYKYMVDRGGGGGIQLFIYMYTCSVARFFSGMQS